MEQTRPLFVHFSSFSHDKYSTNLTINDKSVDDVLGTRTRVGRMVGDILFGHKAFLPTIPNHAPFLRGLPSIGI